MVIELIGTVIKIGSKEILKNINMTIAPSSFNRIKGENGSGKSLLMATLVGGHKNFKGQIIRTFSKNQIVYITEPYFFSDDEKVKQIVLLLSYFYQVSRDLVIDIANKLGLDYERISNLKAGELSTGMKRKLQIIPLYFDHCDIFFLDEIFNGLDQRSQELTLHRLKNLVERNATIVIIEHQEHLLRQLSGNSKEVVWECLNGVVRLMD